MRILQVCQRPQRRGAEVFTHQLSAELRRQGHRVATVYLYPHEGDGLLPLAPDDVRLDGDARHRLETLVGFRPRLLRRFSEAIQGFGPDITQLNGARTLKYGVLSRQLSKAPVGSLVYRNIGTPEDWVLGPRRQVFYRLVNRHVDGVVSITQGSKELLRGRFPEPTVLGVISNAVDPDGLQPQRSRSEMRRWAATPESAPLVLFVGALSPEKRPARLIDAVRRVREERSVDLRAWFVGEGPLRQELEAKVEAAGPVLTHAVRFFGAQDDVASFYSAADMFALVSQTEGIPAVVLEAGLLGLPVVATAVGGVPECVVDGETGVLVGPEDQEGLVDALTRLAEDPRLRRSLGDQAAAHVLQHHSIERIGREFVDFYERLRARPSNDRVSPADLDAETRLLALLSRIHLTPDQARSIEEILESPPDWDRLIDLAYRHKVGPFLCRHLPAFAASVPPEVIEDLEDFEFATSCWVLERTGELIRIVEALREADVIVVPYKGPALGAQIYGSGALRPPGDLDLVVRPRDVKRAGEVLTDLEYHRVTPEGDEAQTSFVLENRYDERFVGPSGTRIELHWAFTNRDSPFAPDLDQLFSRLGSVEVAGHAVPAFQVEDLLLMLSVHGAKHRWDRLEWLAAIAEIARTQTHLDWDALIRRASQMGVRRTLLLPLLLAADLFDAPIPSALLRRARDDRRVTKLAYRVIEILQEEVAGWEPRERLQRDRFRLSLLERPGDVARFLWYRALTPSEPEDWDVRRIGPIRVPVHSLRRPFHAAGRLLNAVQTLVPGGRR